MTVKRTDTIPMTRVWAMPHKYTFKVAPLRDIIDRYKCPGHVWLDPFAGFNSPAEITNDLNPDAPTDFHVEAAEFVSRFETDFADGAIFDPPYSLTQVSRSYRNIGLSFSGKENPTGGFPKVRDELVRVVRSGGYIISYGWNTVGMGKHRGCEPVEYLICSHGGNRNDTLVVVERVLPK
jgi:hypothetical protein